MFLQQLFDLAAERDIAATSCLQVSRTRLGRRHLQGLKEDLSLGQGFHRKALVKSVHHFQGEIRAEIMP